MSFTRELVRSSEKYGFTELEIYTSLWRRLEISIGNDMVQSSVIREGRVTVVRGSMGKKVASLVMWGTTLSPEYVLDKLSSMVRNTPEDPHWHGFPTPQGFNAEVKCYDTRLEELVESGGISKYIIEFTSTLKDEAKRHGCLKAVVAGGMWTLGVVEYSVVNTNGVDINTKCTSNNLFLWVKSDTQRGTSDWGVSLINRRFNEQEVYEKIQREATLISSFAGASPIPSGKYKVVFHGSVAGDILVSALVPAFSALNVLENRSPLKGKLDSEVFSNSFTVRDDPTPQFETGSRPFDDEGVATSPKRLVDRGVVKTYLHSYYTARRMGTGNPGNGFRRSPELPPTPAPSNLIVEPGKGSVEDLAAELGRALVVYDVIGEWNSDPVTGLVKATVTHGLLVENGKVVQPVKGVVVVGNIYKWLKENLVAIGSDLEINGGIGVPSIALEGIDVGGV